MDEFKIDSSLFEMLATLYKLSKCDGDQIEEYSRVAKMVGDYDLKNIDWITSNFSSMSIEDQTLYLKHMINLLDVAKHLKEKYKFRKD